MLHPGCLAEGGGCPSLGCAEQGRVRAKRPDRAWRTFDVIAVLLLVVPIACSAVHAICAQRVLDAGDDESNWDGDIVATGPSNTRIR